MVQLVSPFFFLFFFSKVRVLGSPGLSSDGLVNRTTGLWLHRDSVIWATTGLPQPPSTHTHTLSGQHTNISRGADNETCGATQRGGGEDFKKHFLCRSRMEWAVKSISFSISWFITHAHAKNLNLTVIVACCFKESELFPEISTHDLPPPGAVSQPTISIKKRFEVEKRIFI